MFSPLKSWWFVWIGLYLVCSLSASAQGQPGDGWPQISKDDLALKDNPAEPGAGAMILYRAVSDDDVKGVGFEVYCIKIFNDEGKKFADIEIPYVSRVREVENIQARVLQPEGKVEPFNGQIFEKTSLKFKKYKLQVKAFTFPDVRAGSVIEYSYTTRWRWSEPDYMKNPSQYIFTAQWTIPTVSWDIQEDLYVRRAHFSLRPFKNARVLWTVTALNGSKGPEEGLDGTFSFDVEGVPAYRDEEYMPPESAVRSRVHFYYSVGGYPNADYFWSSIAENRGTELEKFLDKRKAMENEVKTIIAPGDSDTVKLQKIYARVQQLRFLSFEFEKTRKEESKEHIRENKNVEDILKHNSAAANEANLLFIGLVRAAGFDAWPIEVASRDSVFFDKNYLNPTQLNAMVVEVHVGSKDLFFDPATQFCPYGLLPWGENGTAGLRAGSRNGVLVKLPEPQSSDSVIRREVSVQIDGEANADGTMHVVFSGQDALTRRLEAFQKDEAGRRKDLEDEVKGWLPSGASVTMKSSPEWEKADQTLDAQFDVKVPNLGTLAGHHWVLPMAVCEGGRKYPFRSAQRINAVYFHAPYQELDEITLKLPPGFMLESLPAGRNVVTRFGTYNTQFVKSGDSVKLTRREVMDGIYFPTTYYPNLRSFYDSMQSGDGDQIVLKAEETHAKK